MARIAIVGVAVIGVATAWMLCRNGHDVTLVDRNAGPALGASHANGAQLSYAYGDALATPSLLRHLPSIMLARDPAFRISLQADPEFLVWGLRFLANTQPARFLSNTRKLLQMAERTRVLLAELLAECPISFDYDVSGKMILYPSAQSLAGSDQARRLKQEMGIRQFVLDREEATRIEPALALYPDTIAGVVWSPDDAAGRPDLFCARLIETMRRAYGLITLFGHGATGFMTTKGRVCGLTFASREPLDADWVVLATGSAVDLLPWRDRLRVPVWPVQGYSFTAPATPQAMRVSITDVKRKLVFARLGEEVRAAGLADIGHRRPVFDAKRFATLIGSASEAFGGAFETTAVDARSWSNGRPCTPSSRPIIRRATLDGLFLNLGHGTLGWTLCLGAAERLIGLMKDVSVPMKDLRRSHSARVTLAGGR